jgi:hypothetical protein
MVAMNPLLLVAGLGGAAVLLAPRSVDRPHVGALVGPSTLRSYKVIAPAGPSASPPLSVPSGAKALSVYDTNAGGTSVYGAAATLQLFGADGKQTLRVRGPELLALGGTVFVPPGSTKLTIHNAAAAPKPGTPGLHGTVIFHIAP